MFHVDGITKETSLVSDSPETINVEKSDIDETISKNSAQEEPELIAIGCPHLCDNNSLIFCFGSEDKVMLLPIMR